MSQEASTKQMSTSTQFNDELPAQHTDSANVTESVTVVSIVPSVSDVVNALDQAPIVAHIELSGEESTQENSIQEKSSQLSETQNLSVDGSEQTQSQTETSQIQATSDMSSVTEHVLSVAEHSDTQSPELQITQMQSDNHEVTGKKVSFDNIGLDVVSFNRTFCRNRGTLSQMVKSFTDMADRLSEPMNPYQKGLYPEIQSQCNKIVESYRQLLATVDPQDNYVFGFYVNGPFNDGKRKATTTPHEQKSYGVSEYKETLKSTNDRLRHIKTDCQRKLKENTRNNHDVLLKMIDFCDTYHQTVNSHLVDWDTFIAQFRQDNNIAKSEDSVKRSSRIEKRRVVKRTGYQSTVNQSTDSQAIDEQKTTFRRSSRPRPIRNGRSTDHYDANTVLSGRSEQLESMSKDGLNTLRNIAHAMASVVAEVKKQQTSDIVLNTVNGGRSRQRSENPNSERSSEQRVRGQRIPERDPRSQNTGKQNTAQSQSTQSTQPSNPAVRSDTRLRVSDRVLLRSVDARSTTQTTTRSTDSDVRSHVDLRVGQNSARPRKMFRNQETRTQNQTQESDPQTPRVTGTASNSVRVRPKNFSVKKIVDDRAGVNNGRVNVQPTKGSERC